MLPVGLWQSGFWQELPIIIAKNDVSDADAILGLNNTIVALSDKSVLWIMYFIGTKSQNGGAYVDSKTA